jgi:cytochrome c-type biogenesis protein
MGFLTNLLENSTLPWVTAMVLGFMTAISPCPLATNITAVGFISRDIENRKRIFLNGILYTAGRAISYTGLAFILFFGADQLKLSGFFQKYGEMIIGPFLFLIGLLMLGVIKINFPGLVGLTSKMEQKKRWGYLDVMLLGVVFALAFCPYSGVLYFGMLIPLTISSASGLLLPVIFAVATGIPVIITAWILAYAVSGIGTFYNRLKSFEIWFRRVVSVLFIGVGIYYIIRMILP